MNVTALEQLPEHEATRMYRCGCCTSRKASLHLHPCLYLPFSAFPPLPSILYLPSSASLCSPVVTNGPTTPDRFACQRLLDDSAVLLQVSLTADDSDGTFAAFFHSRRPELMAHRPTYAHTRIHMKATLVVTFALSPLLYLP